MCIINVLRRRGEVTLRTMSVYDKYILLYYKMLLYRTAGITVYRQRDNYTEIFRRIPREFCGSEYIWYLESADARTRQLAENRKPLRHARAFDFVGCRVVGILNKSPPFGKRTFGIENRATGQCFWPSDVTLVLAKLTVEETSLYYTRWPSYVKVKYLTCQMMSSSNHSTLLICQKINNCY